MSSAAAAWPWGRAGFHTRHSSRQEIIALVEGIAALLGVAVARGDAPSIPTREAVLTALCRAEASRVDEHDRPEDWKAVADGFDAIGRPYPAAYARFRAAGAVLRERGSRVDAKAALGSARATAVRLGAIPLLAEIDRFARQARIDLQSDPGPRAARADRGDRADLGLTDREREVLGLIATGWSNQEIADALFISRKTASVHASNIFDKLGAANRVEAADIAHRLGLDADAPPPPRAVP